MGSTYTKLVYHIIFSTKERKPAISSTFQDRLYRYTSGIVRNHGGSVISIGGINDHMHLLVRLKPDTSVAESVRFIKSNASKRINESGLTRGRFAWQRGYSAFTVSASQVETVSRYIARQESHHRKMSFLEELRALLKKHGVEYDERYVWD